YRGGFQRSVGAAQLVGPYQDPAARACTGRIVVSQQLLDDGRAGPGTLAAEMAKALEAELPGESYTGLGDLRRIEGLSLRRTNFPTYPEDVFFIGAAPHGYIRATGRLVFDRIDVPIILALVPEPSATALRFRIEVRAELAFGNRVVQWLSDRLGGDA